MHEQSVARSIIRVVEHELSNRNMKDAVEKIRFKAGRLHAIIPDSLTLHFDILKTEHPQLRATELEVIEAPLKARCTGCGEVFELEQPLFICEKCQHPLKVESGEEMEVESFSLVER